MKMFLAIISILFLAVISILLTSITTSTTSTWNINMCNMYEGEWVYDKSYPLFDSSVCKSIRREFDCLKFGRPDRDYLKYRWQPKGCNLPRFDGVDFLRRLRGKKVMFVGDSISLNHFESLICLLKATGAVGNSNIAVSNSSITTVIFKRYGVSISFFSSHYLVDIKRESVGRVLKLDSIKDGETWRHYDVLIFNTWLWWYRRGPKQPWDYVEVNGKISKDMDRMDAFRKGLTTWAKWVNSYVKPSTKVFLQGVNPSHYRGIQWNNPRATNCLNETTPMRGSTYPDGEPLASKVMKEVLKTRVSSSKLVHFLDISKLSQLRKDGHPSKYNGFHGMDCTHWCIAGVLETWNQILYAYLI
ncbi:protein trichome birefringence-like 38 [Andrographis paniculata]|uniref:protein trichome birefringence-like 38 n=1 Tax=Andrographis paniculata TaxID=175694 RepID=UPI0021E731F2|nr:protein trichome birefringence-like 38 [Andrographis paniculata]